MMKRILSLILAAVGIFPLAACSGTQTQTDVKYQLAAALYPEMAPYPDESKYFKSNGDFDSEGFDKVYNAWKEDRSKQLNQPDGYVGALDTYLRAVIPQLLANGNGENRACSPINIYMALAMLAELTEGESRRQILSLLDSSDIDALRNEAAAVWNANYCSDGALASVLASSLWINDQVNFRQSTMDALAKHYYASSFRGEMGSKDFDTAFQDWLNRQTDGLLREQTSGISMDRETVLALAATIYFRAKWSREFSEVNTAPDTFHSDAGDLTCDFMHQSGANAYYWSDRFSAVAQQLEGSCAMWFLLPDKGISPEELFSDKQTVDFLLSGGKNAENKEVIVNLSVPKFDAVSDTELIPSLKALGITNIFDPKISDFSPMTDDIDGVFLSKAKHSARVAIDEEGVTAAAYTVMLTCGAAAPPDEEVDFELNRPFIFAITGADGLPLFVGVVHKPQA